jgi:DNA repair protein RecO (recombination protein O)
MQIIDTGYILKRTLYGESGFILTIFSKEHGIICGLVKRAISSKKLQTLSLGNLIDFSWSARMENHLGLVNAELNQGVGFKIIDSSERLKMLQAILDVIVHSLPERLTEKKLFEGFSLLMESMRSDPLEALYLNYIEFELLLLKELGFEVDLSKCALTGNNENLYYISPTTGRAACKDAAELFAKKLFLIDDLKLHPHNINKKSFIRACKITGHFLQNFIFNLKNKDLPEHRLNLVKEKS